MLNYIVLFVNWLIYPLEYRSCKSNFPTLDFERCDDFVTKSSLKSNKAEETKLDQSGTFFPTRTDDKICKAGKETVLDQFMEKEFGLFCSMILRVQMISILGCLKNALMSAKKHTTLENMPAVCHRRWLIWGETALITRNNRDAICSYLAAEWKIQRTYAHLMLTDVNWKELYKDFYLLEFEWSLPFICVHTN